MTVDVTIVRMLFVVDLFGWENAAHLQRVEPVRRGLCLHLDEPEPFELCS